MTDADRAKVARIVRIAADWVPQKFDGRWICTGPDDFECKIKHRKKRVAWRHCEWLDWRTRRSTSIFHVRPLDAGKGWAIGSEVRHAAE